MINTQPNIAFNPDALRAPVNLGVRRRERCAHTQGHAPSHLLPRIRSVLDLATASRISLPRHRTRSAVNLPPHWRRKTHVASSQCMTSQLHSALASEAGILCGLRVRLALCSALRPSILTTCSTPLPSVAGHPIASRLGAG